MASSERGPVPAERSSASPPSPSTPAFTPDPSSLATTQSANTETDIDNTSRTAVAAAAAAAVAAAAAAAAADSLREPPQQDSVRAMFKRLRSPSLDASVNGDYSSTNPDLSPRKLARLTSGSRFDDASTGHGELGGLHQSEAEHGWGQNDSQHQSQEQHLAAAALSVSHADEAKNVEAQAALSTLRSSEMLVRQRETMASDANPPLAADTQQYSERDNAFSSSRATTEVAAATEATTTLAEAADQLAATDAASAASAAAAVAAIAAAAVTKAEGEAAAAQDSGQMAVDLRQGRQTPLYPNPSHPGAPTHVPSLMPELAPKSPATKRHKCPYCDTEFTRHHNLKSHLLTHSQEKPYVCQGCDMRFRRLHDLKRHSKLHTGEKPHICPRCDRKFARGDALARHTKNNGSCAGRRSSSGIFDKSFEGSSSMMEGDTTAMSGVEYGSTEENEQRRLSLPSLMAHDNRGGNARVAGVGGVASHTRTYPSAPISDGSRGPNKLATGATASVPGFASSTTAATPGSTPANTTRASGTLFPRHGITESPKLLSPGLEQEANGQSAFAQRLVGLATSHGATSLRTGDDNGDTNANIFTSEQGMWSYIQTLEEKLKAQEERIKLQAERIVVLEGYEGQVTALKQRISTLVRQEAEGQQRLIGSSNAASEAGHLESAEAAIAAAAAAIGATADTGTTVEANEQPATQKDEQPLDSPFEQQVGQDLKATVEQ